uniref:Uncharacterized protein n=2 Tax=Anguilla anguilla TaxID=7936 RepID=A0A0E9SQD6_ANGAN
MAGYILKQFSLGTFLKGTMIVSNLGLKQASSYPLSYSLQCVPALFLLSGMRYRVHATLRATVHQLSSRGH